MYRANDFLKSSLYYVFNFIVILCFRYLIDNPNWLKALMIVCKLNLIVQFGVFFLGFGNYWHNTYRYIGTYNDPNQLGFALLSTLSILFLLQAKRRYVYVAIVLFLVYKTGSGGMIIALFLLISFDLITVTIYFLRKGPASIMIFLIALGFIFVLAILVYNNSITLNIDFDVFRIERKINRSGSIVQNFIDDRYLNLAVEKPVYFIFGYGEGFSFFRDGYSGEMHSTWISLFYYYGIIPFVILIKWIIKNIKGVPKKFFPVYGALFLEAFTLINHRQASFWMIIMLGTVLRSEKNGISVTETKESDKCCSSSL